MINISIEVGDIDKAALSKAIVDVFCSSANSEKAPNTLAKKLIVPPVINDGTIPIALNTFLKRPIKRAAAKCGVTITDISAKRSDN